MKRILCLRPVGQLHVATNAPFTWHIYPASTSFPTSPVATCQQPDPYDMLLAYPLESMVSTPEQQPELQESWYRLGEQFSPYIGWDDAQWSVTDNDATDQPTCMLLDITRTAEHWENETALLQAAVGLFHQHGYCVQGAIAHTVGAAWGGARYGHHLTRALQVSRPNPSSAANYQLVRHISWKRLPIVALRLPVRILELLRQLGLQTVEQLLVLPREAMRARFGDLLLSRMDELTGQRDEPIVPYTPAPRWTVSRAFEHPLRHHEAVEHEALDLLSELCEQLQQQQRGIIQLDCTWQCAERGSVALRVGTYRPTADKVHLGSLLRMHLANHRLPGPLHEMLFHAATTTALRARQEVLFAELSDEQPKELAELVDRLSCRLGSEAIVHAQLLAEPQIERNYRYVPLTGPQSRRTSTSSAALQHHARGIGQRPCRLLTRPVRLVIPDENSPMNSELGPPRAFVFQDCTYHVAQHWGPERIETGWWHGPTICRDYYRVADEQGRRFWLFHDLRHAVWFMHGVSI